MMDQKEFISMFEAIKKSCVMAMYSGGLCNSPESERDSCASKIRLLTITEVVRGSDGERFNHGDSAKKMEE